VSGRPCDEVGNRKSVQWAADGLSGRRNDLIWPKAEFGLGSDEAGRGKHNHHKRSREAIAAQPDRQSTNQQPIATPCSTPALLAQSSHAEENARSGAYACATQCPSAMKYGLSVFRLNFGFKRRRPFLARKMAFDTCPATYGTSEAAQRSRESGKSRAASRMPCVKFLIIRVAAAFLQPPPMPQLLPSLVTVLR